MPATASTDLFLSEAFSSIQGEGLHIGSRQVFLRLCDCNLNCSYCDTDFQRKERCQLETDAGTGQFESTANPVSIDYFIAMLDRWLESTPNLHQAISLTGGEPLLHAEKLISWLPELKKRLPIHLETNGTLVQPLKDLLPNFDFLSIDLKLASITGQPTPWEEHQQFLVASAGRPAQIKIVVDKNLSTDELLRAAELAAESRPGSPLYLQPVTADNKASVAGAVLMNWQKLAARKHPDCRIVPQIHPLLGIA